MTQSATSRAADRLAGVDGLRAFAAIWVVLFHVHLVSGASFPQVPFLDLFWTSGWTGVSLFLVLSGFCLYVPFAGGRQHRFKTVEFLRRRAWRLLPAYYLSLAFVVPLHLAFAKLLGGSSALTATQTLWHALAHATMTHIFFPDTFYSLNGVYWSLALEWQWYAALPLLVLAAARWGVVKAAGAAIAINVVYSGTFLLALHWHWLPDTGLLTGAVLPNQLYARIAEFALGVVAAELYVSGRLGWVRPLRNLAPLVIPGVLVASYLPLSTIVFGALFFVLLCIVLTGEGYAARAFASKPVVALGLMSYSLYLVHHPLLKVFGSLLKRFLHVGPNAEFILLLATVPVVLVLAWLFFLVGERPTLSSRYSLSEIFGGDLLLPSRWLPALGRFGGAPQPVPAAVPQAVPAAAVVPNAAD